MAEFKIVQDDDWSGLYKDGVLVYENHEIEPDVLESFGLLTYEHIDYVAAESGRMPETLAAVEEWKAAQ